MKKYFFLLLILILLILSSCGKDKTPVTTEDYKKELLSKIMRYSDVTDEEVDKLINEYQLTMDELEELANTGNKKAQKELDAWFNIEKKLINSEPD